MKTALQATTAVLFLALGTWAQPDPADLWNQYRKAAIEADTQGRQADAEKYWRAALKVAEAFGPGDFRLAITLNNLGSICFSSDRYDEAITYLQRELAVHERMAPEGSRYTINALNSLAMVYGSREQEAEAESCYRRALKLADSASEPDPVALALVLNNYGAFQSEHQRYQEAEILYERLLELVRKAPVRGLRPRAPDTVQSLVSVYERQGKYSDAEFLLLEELNAEERQGHVDSRLGEALRRMADYHAGHDEFELAAMLYERALGVLGGLKKSQANGFTAQCLFSLAEVYAKWGLPDKAEATYRRELEIEMEDLGVSYLGTPVGLSGLGNLYRDQGRLEEVEPMAREALRRLEEKLGPEHAEIVSTLTYLAQIESELKKPDEEESLLRRAIAIQEKTLGPNHPQLANTLQQYAAALRANGRDAEANQISKRVEQIRGSGNQ